MEFDSKKKYEKLKEIIAKYDRVAVAFSGGVDSSLLLKAASDVLGNEAIAIRVRSEVVPEREEKIAADFCKANGIRCEIINFRNLDIPGFKENTSDRCYICKSVLFRQIKEKAKEFGIINVFEGSIVDDLGDYRPGMRAVEELGVKSPLKEAGFTKEDVRSVLRDMLLPVWSKPSFSCLATRFAYGEEITEEKLKMVDGAEQFLFEKGFNQCRVRVHGGGLARIEVNQDAFEKLMADREEIVDRLKSLGFTYITMDAMGYRSGSMNEVLLAGEETE